MLVCTRMHQGAFQSLQGLQGRDSNRLPWVRFQTSLRDHRTASRHEIHYIQYPTAGDNEENEMNEYSRLNTTFFYPCIWMECTFGVETDVLVTFSAT